MEMLGIFQSRQSCYLGRSGYVKWKAKPVDGCDYVGVCYQVADPYPSQALGLGQGSQNQQVLLARAESRNGIWEMRRLKELEK